MEPGFVIFTRENPEHVYEVSADDVRRYTFYDLLLAWMSETYQLTREKAEDKCYYDKPTLVIYDPKYDATWEYEYGRVIIH